MKRFLTLFGLVTRRSLMLFYAIHFLADRKAGEPYSIGAFARFRLLLKILRNRRHILTLSSPLEHLEMAAAILSIPPSVKGDVIECGCYLGGSTANLSLVCSLVGRRLVVCDSFAGLPVPSPEDRAHYAVFTGHTDLYEEGRFTASLDEAKANISHYGDLDTCDFVVGYFEDTLPGLGRNYVMAFLDVDLVSSLEPCVTSIWPNLADGCRVYVHEARSLALVSLFFDKAWWAERLGQEAPGFVGAGTGLPLSPIWGSEIGYAQKGRPTYGERIASSITD
jgi:O-methyltransferase